MNRMSYSCAHGAHHECLLPSCPCGCHEGEDDEQRQADWEDHLDAEAERRRDQGP